MIPFCKTTLGGSEKTFIIEALESGQIAGNESFSERCEIWLKEKTNAHFVSMAHSCTAALEMSALLANVEPGDEIIMPSFTFVSTANAFV